MLSSILLLAVATQVPPGSATPEDEAVPGFPAGEPAPLPDRVNWDLTKAVTGKTRTRERMSLAGLWRFAPVADNQTAVERAEMGWLDMPGHWASGSSKILDSRLRVTDDQWHGRPLEEYRWAWVERELTLTNANLLKWFDHRVFLVIRGPWRLAEVYADGEPIPGTDHDDTRWFEITESLSYPGTTTLSMRLGPPTQDKRSGEPAGGDPAAAAAPSDPEAAADSSYVGLELVPTGARVEAIRLARDVAQSQIEASVDLLRPLGVPLPGGAAGRAAFNVTLRLEDAGTGDALADVEHDVGAMPKNKNTTTAALRLPLASEKEAPARLHVLLRSETGQLLDEPFPIEFAPPELRPATETEKPSEPENRDAANPPDVPRPAERP